MVVAAAAWAQAPAAVPGLVASGRAVVETAAGPRMGAIRLELQGARRARIEIRFLGGERYTLTSNDGQFSAQGRGDLLALLAASGLHQG
ncbi:MAG: hypothetical protein ACRD1E_12605, partial [Terriglobales bacterium]